VKDFRGKVAAITGAGSGIGRALAVNLAGQGAHLALSDVDEAGLAATVSLCEGRAVKVTSQRVDVADRQAVHAWADQVVADHGHVNLVFNNAGVAVAAEVQAMRYEDLDWLMGINFYGVVHGTKAFLPHLRESGQGHVVNISSVFGLVAIPSQSAYNAAKFAVRGFTEALRLELDSNPADGVSCTTVHPGGIKTNIANNARIDPSAADGDAAKAIERFNRSLMTSPDKAAAVILAGVQADQRRVLIGPDARLFGILAHLPIGVTQRLVRAGSRRMR
jgi:short-subunit dehydrogenase